MEQELKFALPAADPQQLEKQLRRSPLIGRRKATRRELHNVYYDTPEHALQRHRIALRVRQTGSAAHPAWVQTLKTGGATDSALSRRGEWEAPLSANQLDRTLLDNTPWPELDPQGDWFAALAPVFTTTFERLSWIIHLDDAQLELALDRGSVWIDGQTTPLCELEIELLSGAPAALFDAAWQIGQQLALLPLHMSKAERAYRLAQGTLFAPLRARPPAVHPEMDRDLLAQTVLRESFLQFSANLNTLRSSDAPEVLHQARVGWRRFKSALRLFKIAARGGNFPDLLPLKPLLALLTGLRDLDVAACEVLPLYAEAYQDADAVRVQHWQQLQTALAESRQAQRHRVCEALADPAVGCTLLLVTRWLETPLDGGKGRAHAATGYVRKRVAQLAEKLEALPVDTPDPLLQHRLRILAKRLRYGIESLRPLLPKKRAERWYRLAIACQTQIGLARDQQQALKVVLRLQAASGIAEFLRGALFSGKRLRQHP